MEDAIRRFCVTARMRRPSMVFFSTSCSTAKTDRANTMIQRRDHVSVSMPTSKEPDIHDGLLT